MFTGEFRHTLDSKNRISIPARFRELAGDVIYVTRGLDGCLFLFAKNDWEHFSGRLAQLPISNKEARKFARTFLSGAAECELDKQGRILLPQYLVDYAGVEKDAYINGAGARMELWEASKWEEYSLSLTNDIDEISEGMENLGIRF